MQDVEKILSQLPPEARRELMDYAEFLLHKYGKKRGKRPNGFTFSWEDKLKDVTITSVELQHKASEWRANVSD
ncbi:DUF2281 domain-containing protein [Thermococcus sp.]|uniref:DUF2281 domain-containing protein n=1 Tax=Thermococcus sp. TaxID=35749 RepID=UPI00260BFBB6|nr:DUF2281 domain-containing protein [Thermococcus sp.]